MIVSLVIGAVGLAPHLGTPAVEALDLAVRIAGVGRRLRHRAARVDDDTLEHLVSAIRDAAPVRSGRLSSLVEGHMEDDLRVVTARATATRAGGLGADYAPFVEEGTAPHGPYRHTASGRHGGHPGTEPQPFFWNTAEDILGVRVDALQVSIGAAGADEGFD